MAENNKVLILGASPKPERFSHMALILLVDKGHRPILVNPSYKEIEGHPCYQNLKEAKENHPEIHTLTLYLNPSLSNDLATDIFDLKIKRVIFNPGSENRNLKKKLEDEGIKCQEVCTLVLLRMGRF